MVLQLTRTTMKLLKHFDKNLTKVGFAVGNKMCRKQDVVTGILEGKLFG